ncbi:MAG: Hpt domain-containing protein [Bacteroidota bacterium]
MMEELKAIFKEEISEELSNLKKGFTQHDYEVVAKVAHKVKSASGMMGYMDLMRKAEQIENIYRHGEGERNDALIQDLITDLELTLND